MDRGVSSCAAQYRAPTRTGVRREQGPERDRGHRELQPPLTNYRFSGIDALVFGSSASANFRESLSLRFKHEEFWDGLYSVPKLLVVAALCAHSGALF